MKLVLSFCVFGIFIILAAMQIITTISSDNINENKIKQNSHFAMQNQTENSEKIFSKLQNLNPFKHSKNNSLKTTNYNKTNHTFKPTEPNNTNVIRKNVKNNRPKQTKYTHSKNTKPNLPRPRTITKGEDGTNVEIIYSASPEGEKYVTRKIEYDENNNVIADIHYYKDGTIYYQEFYEYYENGFTKSHTRQVVNGGGTPNYIEYFNGKGNVTRTDYYDIETGRFLYSQ